MTIYMEKRRFEIDRRIPLSEQAARYRRKSSTRLRQGDNDQIFFGARKLRLLILMVEENTYTIVGVDEPT